MSTARALKRFFTTYCISLVSLVLLTTVILSALFPYLQRKSSTGCGCDQFAAIPNTPASWFLFSLLVTSAVYIGWVGLRMVVMMWQTHRFRRSLQQQVIRTTSYQGTPIHTVTANEPTAVCLGYIHPHIYISRSLIHTLSGFEVLAVMQHELEHAKRLDPLQRLLLQALPSAMLKRYAAVQEIIADEAVTDRPAIRSAFVKLTDKLSVPVTALAVTWFSTSQARINHWLGEPIKLPTFRLGVIISLVFSLVLIVSYRAFAAEPVTQAFGQCLADQTMCESVMSYVVQ